MASEQEEDRIQGILELAERMVQTLHKLERRTVCPECFHLRAAGHSYICKIKKHLDDWNFLNG